MAYLENKDTMPDLSITIFEFDPAETDGAAQLKFDREATDFEDDEEQNEVIIDDEVGDGALSIKCDMTKVVHGTLTKDGAPATLIVLQFAFLPHGNNRRFKEVEITLWFSSGKVHSIAPSNQWTTLPSETQQERTHSISPSIEAALGPAKAATAYTWERKETETIRGYAKVVGEIKALDQPRTLVKRRRNNGVFWGLYEDKRAQTGLPTLLQTAVLLEREATKEEPLGEKFSARIKIHGNVNRRAWLQDKWVDAGKWMMGRTRKGKDIVFNPRVSRGTVPDQNSLAKEPLASYQRLIAIHEWVEQEKGSTPEESVREPDKESANLAPQSLAIEAARATPTAGSISPAPPVVVAPSMAPALSLPPPSAQVSQAAQSITPGPGTGAAASPLPLAHSTLSLTQPYEEQTSTAEDHRSSLLNPLTSIDIRDEELPDSTATTTIVLGDQELPYLREQLGLVRAEKKWAVRIASLLSEERRLLQSIKQLELTAAGLHRS